MDAFDKKILQLIQSDTRQTSEQLGQAVGLSATAVQRRLKALRDNKIIRKEVALLDGEQLGHFITVVVEVVMVRGGTQVTDNFKKKVQNFPEVQQCYYVAGENDFILIISTNSLQRYEALTKELLLSDGTVYKFYSNIAMDNIKVGAELPLS